MGPVREGDFPPDSVCSSLPSKLHVCPSLCPSRWALGHQRIFEPQNHYTRNRSWIILERLNWSRGFGKILSSSAMWQAPDKKELLIKQQLSRRHYYMIQFLKKNIFHALKTVIRTLNIDLCHVSSVILSRGRGILELAHPGGNPGSELASLWPWASHFPSLGLSFLICIME